MKKLPKWAKIVLPIFFVVALAAILLVPPLYVYQSGINQLTPLPTGQVTSSVFVAKVGHDNFFLIRGDDGYIMIDASGDKEQAESALQELGILAEDVSAIFLTHTDPDHIAAISLFPNANLYLSELEVQMIDGTTRRASGLLLFLATITRHPILDHSFEYEYSTLADNEVIEIDGNVIQAISTPGHTLGSMSFLVNDKYLFTGDAMSMSNGRADLFISLLNMDEDMAAESISRLAEVQAEYIFTAHHGYSTDLAYVFEGWD